MTRARSKFASLTGSELGLFVAVVLGVTALVLAGTFLLRTQTPQTQRTTAKLQFSFPRLKGPKVAYDPVVMQAEMEVMQADGILRTVAEKLALNGKWRSDTGTNPAPVSEILEKLKSSIRIRQLPRTTIVEIIVLLSDPEESATVANTLAETYTQYFRTREIEQLGRPMRLLTLEKEEKLKLAEQAETRLFELQRDKASSNVLWEAAMQLTNAQLVLADVTQRIEQESTEMLLPRAETLGVLITDRAEPWHSVPQRRHVMNWTRSSLGGGLFGIIAGIVAVLWRRSHLRTRL